MRKTSPPQHRRSEAVPCSKPVLPCALDSSSRNGGLTQILLKFCLCWWLMIREVPVWVDERWRFPCERMSYGGSCVSGWMKVPVWGGEWRRLLCERMSADASYTTSDFEDPQSCDHFGDDRSRCWNTAAAHQSSWDVLDICGILNFCSWFQTFPVMELRR